MTKMLFVRHGQSEWNAVGRWQGQADPPLSALGERQAAAAAAQLPNGIAAVFGSPLQRAQSTAAGLTEGADLPPVQLLDDLVERSVGEWSGLTHDDIEAEWPGYLSSGQRPPTYEHDEPLLERIDRAFGVIHEQHPDDLVLVVAHGGIVYAMEARVGRRHRRLANLSGVWLDWHDDTLHVGNRVDLLAGLGEVQTSNAGL